jgi:uncharacterized protein (TIGR02466 family)
MQSSQVMGIFPEPIARYSVWPGTWPDQLDQVGMEFRDSHSYSQDHHVLDQWPSLKNTIELCVQAFAREIMAFRDVPRITQSWINRYQSDQYIHQHNHPNSMISATWYWRLDSEAEILFHKHGLNTGTTWVQKFDRDTNKATGFSVETTSIRVSEGDLLIWPSYLIHSVPAWQGVGERCSLSLNAQPETWGSDLYRSR